MFDNMKPASKRELKWLHLDDCHPSSCGDERCNSTYHHCKRKMELKPIVVDGKKFIGSGEDAHVY